MFVSGMMRPPSSASGFIGLNFNDAFGHALARNGLCGLQALAANGRVTRFRLQGWKLRMEGSGLAKVQACAIDCFLLYSANVVPARGQDTSSERQGKARTVGPSESDGVAGEAARMR